MINPLELIALFVMALNDNWGYIWGTAGVKWTQAKQDALNQTTDANRALSRQYGAKWIGHMVADCSGLFTWAFKQLGGYMYHGSNTMYDKYCTDKGKLVNGLKEDGQSLKPGTAVFTGTENKHGHVGLYIGDGWVIEAQGTKAGVVKSKLTLSKWTYWGELKGVNYSGSQPEPQPIPDQKPTLRTGDKGAYVTLLQTKLIQRGYDLNPYGADGDFGNKTLAAVKKFQSDCGLTVDGVVGAKTWNALESETIPLYTVTIPHLSKEMADDLLRKYVGVMHAE